MTNAWTNYDALGLCAASEAGTQPWSVLVEEKTQLRLDLDLLAERFGAEEIDACRTTRTSYYVRVERAA